MPSFILYLSLSQVHGTDTVVSPDPDNDVECQEMACFLLHDLSENPQLFFRENSYIYFSPGVHIGTSVNEKHLLVSNTAGIHISGDSINQSVIQCSGNFGFAFVNVTNLSLWNLRFEGCGANVSRWIANRTSPGNSYADPTFRSTIQMIDVWNASIWSIDIYDSYISTGIVGINVVGVISLEYSILDGNLINLLLQADDSAEYLIDTHIQIKENVYLWSATKRGMYTLFEQQKYDINLELQNVEVWYGDSVGIELNIDLCHNSVNIDQLESNDNFGDHMLLYLWNHPNSFCSKIGEIVLSNSHFQQLYEGITIRNRRELTIISSSYINLVNITFDRILSPLNIHNVPNITLQNINVSNCFGIVIKHENSTIKYTGSSFIWDNNGAQYGVMLVWNSIVAFQGHTQFFDNSGFYAGVIYVKNSNLVFGTDSITTFENNHGHSGGAMALYGLSLIDIEPNATVVISHNKAIAYGGGIYVDESDDYLFLVGSYQQVRCFFQPSIRHTYKEGIHGNVIFTNNTAGKAGNELFGGWGDICISYTSSLNLLEVGENYFNSAFHFSADPNDISSIASKPSRVCICTENTSFPNCSIVQYNTTSYPGTTVRLSVVTTGQRFGVVPGVVTVVEYVRGDPIPTLQQHQTTLNHCTEVGYTVSSSNCNETLILFPQDGTSVFNDLNAKMSSFNGIHNGGLILSLFAAFEINVFLLPCPVGFVLDQTTNMCDCHSLLKEYGINCSIETQKIYRRAPLWIYGLEDGVIVHEHCPLDYCKSGSFDINFKKPDDQCAFHRSGVLCGGCQMGYSQVLGSTVCTQCSSWWVLIVLPFALAGLASVAAIVFLNTTVSVGTINGLLFYANIVRANEAIFFPERSKGSVTSVIMAWLNLDIGIKVCLLDGMDAYVKTWLQPIFPIYMWTIVIVIIVSSHYSIWAAKLCGRNTVSVLATLFLLSYVKMLRVLTSTLSFTILDYPDGRKIKVWLYDGNVYYMQGRHIALLLAVLIITTTLTIPYTVFLLFAHVFQSKSNHRLFRFWIPRLIPLIDAHTGPYLVCHRHWTGVLLLFRVALILVSSVNIFGDPAINLLAIIIAVLCLFIYLIVFGSMYRNPHLTKLEFLFHANLLLTAAVSLYARSTGGNQEIVTHTFVSIALVGLAGILCYHLLLVLKTCPVWTWLRNQKKVSRQENENIELKSEVQIHNNDNEGTVNVRDRMLEGVQHQVFITEYREPLLSDH